MNFVCDPGQQPGIFLCIFGFYEDYFCVGMLDHILEIVGTTDRIQRQNDPTGIHTAEKQGAAPQAVIHQEGYFFTLAKAHAMQARLNGFDHGLQFAVVQLLIVFRDYQEYCSGLFAGVVIDHRTHRVHAGTQFPTRFRRCHVFSRNRRKYLHRWAVPA